MTMKTFKQFLTAKDITEEDFKAKTSEEMATLYNEYNEQCLKEISEDVKGKASKDDIPNLEEALKDYVKNDEDFKNISTQLKEVRETLKVIKDNTQPENENVSLYDSIAKAIRDKAEDIKALKGNRNGSVEIKAVGTMTVAGNLTGRVIRQEREAGSTGVARRKPFVLDLVSVGQTNAGTYYYVERSGHEGAPTMTAEGASKPAADWDYVERSASSKKIAVIVTISKEMLDDIDGIIADVNFEIDEQINLIADGQLLTGDGTGNNLSGLADNATAFAAGALADTVDNAGKLDVLRAGVAQVQRQFFEPTAIVMHPDDVASLDLEKGASDGHYVLPPFTSNGNTMVKGVPIISNTNVTADNFYVGDFTKYKAKIREGLTLDVGYRGAAGDWEKNFVSFLGEMRLFGYIPENHFGAIVKGDFTTAAALLETP